MIPDFNWLPLTWDAVAVLATSLAAVFGAIFVGGKQAEITKLQVKIQKDQAEADKRIRENELKFSLLERRSLCINGLKELHVAFHSSQILSDEDRTKLFSLIQDAELIFEANLIEGLNEIRSNSIRVPSKHRLANSYYSQGNDQMGREALDAAFAMMDEIYERLPYLINSMINHSRISNEA